MQDNLENSYRQNRENLDYKEVPKDLWEKIDSDLTPQVKTGKLIPDFIPYWSIAAMLAIALAFFFGFYLGKGVPNEKQQLAVQLPEDFLVAEAYYQEVINEKKDLVFSHPLSEDMSFDFNRDLAKLDTVYMELKVVYQKKGQQPRLLEQMIVNLKMRLNLLERQLEIIEKSKSQNHEKKISA